MGSESSNGITDLFGIAKSCEKLFNTVAMGLGTIYEPWHTVRMAKAKAKEISIISNAISQNISLPIRYDNGEIHINAEDANQLAIRAQNRALYQEMKKQQNIENVITKAYCQLENKELVNEEPVDPDWINEFFDNVANISNDNMQLLWARVLAGEVLNPSSFSLRTLSTLKNLSQQEATLFSQIAPYILINKSDGNESLTSCFLLSDSKLLDHNNIRFGYILLLNEAGLINTSGNTVIVFNMKPKDSVIIKNGKKTIHMENTSDQEVSLEYGSYPLTEAGVELLDVALQNNASVRDDYIEECLNIFQHHGYGPLYQTPLHNKILTYIE